MTEPLASARGPVLVTGASGFVGSAVVRRLQAQGRAVRAAVRTMPVDAPASEHVVVGDVGPTTDWTQALRGVSDVVHCAARVHQLRDTAADPLAAFRRTNLEGTRALAEQAARSGVRRLLFVSSVGVNGAETYGRPFREGDTAAPHSPYALSKLEAESALHAIAAQTRLEVVVVRPPLVYGPGAPGNFAALIAAVGRGVPLPFGAIHNRRSFVAVANLVDFLVVALAHPQAPGLTFFVSDGEDLSTTELLRLTATALHVRARLLPVPAAWLRGTMRWLGRAELGQRLCGSLQVDISAARDVLGWRPVVGVKEALVDTAQHFLAAKAREEAVKG